MKKYFLIARDMWDEMLTYRLNMIMWRVRVVLNILVMYFLWSAILPVNKTLFGYSQSLMLTYIFATSLIAPLVLASRSSAEGDEIKSGDLSNFLLRPINYFYYWFAKDAGDKAMNVLFSVVELTILFIFLRPPIFLQTNLLFLFLSLIATLSAVIIYFYLNFLIGLCGFWISETWPLRFLFIIIFIQFFSGGLFPLDILPKPIYTIFQMLPFTYLQFFPIKIYLGQLSMQNIAFGLSISFLWVIVLYYFTNFVWKKGLQVYTAQGR